jgi:hypothetical protein
LFLNFQFIFIIFLSAAFFSSCAGTGDDGGSNEPAEKTPLATGGTVSFIQSGSFWDEVHVFTTDGTLTVTRAPDAGTVRVLVVAGGGGGGKSGVDLCGGGGGAGGLLMQESLNLTDTVYSVTVGAGGPGGSIETGEVRTYSGSDSSIIGSDLSIIASGGGGGGWHLSYNPAAGAAGGSGGASPANLAAGVGTPGQGNNGAKYLYGVNYGGGGGYSSPGLDNDGGGAGGAGLSQVNIPAAVDVQNIPTEFATGGTGGNEANGAPNTGDGGGGGGPLGSDGGAGGSGIVIIRFPYIEP